MPFTASNGKAMKRWYYFILVICCMTECITGSFILFAADAAKSAVTNRLVEYNDRDMLNSPVYWDQCLSEQQQVESQPLGDAINDKDFKLNIFFHYGNQYSIRLKTWKSIINNLPAELSGNAIGLSVVPYVIDNKGNHYPLIPKIDSTSSKLVGYYKACQPNQSVTEYPNLYPTLRLNIKDTQERGQLLDFLKSVKTRDFLEKPLGKNEGFSLYVDPPGKTRAKRTPQNSPINTLGNLLQLVFEKKEAYFLNEWTRDQIEVYLLGFGSTISYHIPKESKLSKPGIAGRVHIRLPDQLTDQDMSEKMRAEGCDKIVKAGLAYAAVCKGAKILRIENFKPIKIDETYIELKSIVLRWPEPWKPDPIPESCLNLNANIATDQMECVYQANSSRIITIGDSWAPIRLTDAELKQGEVNLSIRLAPRWPFADNDPWFQTGGQTNPLGC